MSNRDFMEPTPYSIDEGGLEDMLLSIGSGVKAPTASPTASSRGSTADLSVGIQSVLESIKSLPKQHTDRCLAYLLRQIDKFKANLVCENVESAGKEKCLVGKKNNQIIYRNMSIQGTWTGLEVIIDADDSGSTIVIARSNGDDWHDVTKSYKIIKS